MVGILTLGLLPFCYQREINYTILLGPTDRLTCFRKIFSDKNLHQDRCCESPEEGRFLGEVIPVGN